MPVRDFIHLGEAKQTVEKAVKPKLSTAELTTIESPGRPVPASQLEPPERKARRRAAKKPTSSDVSVKNPKRDSILIITEKPQSAQKIALALGSPRQYSEDRVSYYEVEHNNEKIIVASAVGHLFNLTYVPGQTGYPIFELEWTPSYNKKSAVFTKRYFELLKKLARRAKEFVIATDYDIEGEVIGWNVLRFICNKETAKRMKYSTLTKDELLKSYEKPMSELDWGQAYAGETRHYLDWLYGINLSRALMAAIKTSGSFKILSIGRVQGPALKIIVDREKEIEAFKPEPFWQVFALTPDSPIEYKHPKDIFDKKELEKFKDVKEANAETKNSEEHLPPPPPFDLTSLQREAYAHHRMPPSEVLRTAQKLYLDGLISYPRTSSQKIPDSIAPKKILEALSKHFKKFTSLVSREKPIEGKKSDPAHPSIYPTGEMAALSGNEEKLFNLIVKRFISCFAPDAVTDNRRTMLKDVKNPELNFTASGLKIKDKGWTQIYPAVLEERDIPELNGRVRVDEIKFEEKETQPPKRFTPTSLITLLEKKNLGTKATRSMIVDTLFDRGYLDGKSIKATPLGFKLIESLEKYSPIIIDENLTRQLEEQMEKIQASKSGFKEQEEKILEMAKKLITDITKEFKLKEVLIGRAISAGLESQRKEEQENNTLMICPTCKTGKLRIIYSKKTKRQFVGCSNYPNCTQTYSLPPNALIKNTGKTNENGLPILVAIKKGKRPWEFPLNPNWREDAKKEEN